MFEYNEDYLRQRIRDLQQECTSYNTQPNWPAVKKTKKTSTFKKFVSYVIYFLG